MHGLYLLNANNTSSGKSRWSKMYLDVTKCSLGRVGGGGAKPLTIENYCTKWEVRHSEVKQFSQGHKAGRQQRENLNQSLPTSKPGVCQSVMLSQERRQNNKELMGSNAGEDSWKSLGQQRDQTSQSYRRSTLNIHCKEWCWSWSSNILVIWC